jgi:uncharacterized protein (TIGR02284 family)
MINDYEATQPMTTDARPVGTTHEGDVTNADVVSTLNNLIETCRDGQEGFREAAEGCDRTDLKTFFNSCSLERAGFAGELQSLVRGLGEEPADEGSFAGALHRGWMDLKTAIAGNDDEAILNECERGEDVAKKAYNDALQTNLPGNIRNIVEQQAAAVLDKHDRIKALRDFTNNRAAGATPA